MTIRHILNIHTVRHRIDCYFMKRPANKIVTLMLFIIRRSLSARASGSQCSRETILWSSHGTYEKSGDTGGFAVFS